VHELPTLKYLKWYLKTTLKNRDFIEWYQSVVIQAGCETTTEHHMWTDTTRARMGVRGSDLTDAEWPVLEPVMPGG
jgi:hypothetical protein